MSGTSTRSQAVMDVPGPTSSSQSALTTWPPTVTSFVVVCST